jgi:hypothetical protein
MNSIGTSFISLDEILSLLGQAPRPALPSWMQGWL